MLPTPKGAFALAAGAVLLVMLPFMAHTYYVELATTALVAAMLALSLQLLVGCTGLVSLGHGAFYGLAAYTVYLVTPENAGLSIIVTLPLAVITAGAAALEAGGALEAAGALRARGRAALDGRAGGAAGAARVDAGVREAKAAAVVRPGRAHAHAGLALGDAGVRAHLLAVRALRAAGRAVARRLAARGRGARGARRAAARGRGFKNGVPSGIRTRVAAVKGRCPGPG